MVYTQQHRKTMNKAVRSLYPDIDFYERPIVSVMECKSLPQGAVRIIDSDDFFLQVDKHCRQANEMGLGRVDYRKALPVFIRSMELTGKNSESARFYYRVNYVSATEGSLRKAAQYIAEGKLYAVIQ